MHIPPVGKLAIKGAAAAIAAYAVYIKMPGTKREKILSSAVAGGTAYAASHFALQMVPSQPPVAAVEPANQ